MKTRIFLFTKDAQVSKAISEIGQKSEWEGALAGSIDGALACLREYDWDIVIVDAGHRGIGFLIFDALKSADDETPIIVLTERNADYFQALALANGASEVLTTPVNAEELQEAVTRLCQHGFHA